MEDSIGPATENENLLPQKSSGQQPAFKVSDSVKRNCFKGVDGRCDDQMLFLVEQMLSEKRDEPWARQCEEHLRRLVSGAEQRYSIRQLQCGSTICAMEVTSPVGSYFGNFEQDDWLKQNLSLSDRTNGYELDPAGQRVTVTLGVCSRD